MRYDPPVRPRVEERDGAIVDVVIRLLETEGYEAVQVRRVAAEASVSLTTLYKLYGSRDELIIRAMERWMMENAYAGLETLAPAASVHDTLVSVIHTVFARWERQPHMLTAYIRARMSPGGVRLEEQGFGLVEERLDTVFAALGREFVEDLRLIVVHVLLAALERFAAGEIAVTEISAILERTLRRVLAGAPETQPTTG